MSAGTSRWCLALFVGTLPPAAVAQQSPMPPIPEPSSFERELLGSRVLARRIVVENVRSVPEAEVRAIVAPFEGRSLGEGELRDLERRLTQLYVDRGFVTSGVLLARRPAAEGEVAFTAVEGKLEQVRFSSPLRYAAAGWLTSLLVPQPEEPLRVSELQERMAALRESGVVDRINAEIVPLPEPGASELVVSVEERRPWSAEVRYDNYHSPVVGARRPSLWFEHRNVTGWGDRFDGHVGRTEGLDDFHVAYSVGLPRSPWRFGARYERSDSLAIDPPAFRDLEITTDSTTQRVEVSHALIGQASRALSASLALERRDSKSTLLGLPFSFIAGLLDGIVEIDVARLAAEYTQMGTNSVLFLRGQWSEGRSRLPVIDVEGAPAERFRSLAAQGQYAMRLNEAGAQVLLRVDAQYSPDTLFPIEKKAVGGAESVRGYRENVLLRDSAIVATLEGRYPVWARGDSRLSVAAFVDAAYARDSDPRFEEPVRSIASVGLGLIAALPYGFSARIDYAYPNRRWLTENADSQDRGLHFRVSWAWGK
jgi:hemolysin activation/secretion protein